MARGGIQVGNYSSNHQCPVCGIKIEILNNDIQFSMELHLQTHKSLDTITQEIDMRLREAQLRRNGKFKDDPGYSCPQCHETVEIINNDVSLSLQLHSQKHKPISGFTKTHSEDQSSTSSGKSKSSEKQSKNKKDNPRTQPAPMSILDSLFNAMPPGLKAHQGFVDENDSGKALCNICQMKIEPMFSIAEHLKTKLHEDNVILFLKKKLSNDLLQIMEYVSFYGSNLCCNLCRCKIDLCSSNLHETIVNIMAHNAGKDHISKKTTSDNNHDSMIDDSVAKLIVKALSSINPVVATNKHYIDFKMQPQFKCSLCEKFILFDKDENATLKNFVSHFNSAGHTKCCKAVEILKLFQGSNQLGKDRHSFIASKGNIRCTICDCNMEASIEQLSLHVNQKILNKTNVNANNSQGGFNTSTGGAQQNENKQFDIKALLKSLVAPFKNVGYIVANDQGGVTCQLCSCPIPATKFNLETHLLGNQHKKSLGAIPVENKPKTPNNAKAVFSFDQVYEMLSKSDPLIASNKKYLVRYSDGIHYTCTLCWALIKASQDIDVFRENIYSHIESNGHNYSSGVQSSVAQVLSNDNFRVIEFFKSIPGYLMKYISFIKSPVNGFDFLFCTVCNFKLPPNGKCLQEHLEGVNHEVCVERYNNICHDLKTSKFMQNDDVLIENLMKTDKVIKSGFKYLQLDGEHYICKLCKRKIIRSNDEKVLKDNLRSHLEGHKHKKGLANIVEDMLQKLSLSDTVIKLERNFLKPIDGNIVCKSCNCTVSASTEEELFRKNIVSHLTGKKHANSKANINQNPSTGQSKIPENLATNHHVKQLFQSLPTHFQADSRYITNSPIDGYLLCSLCKCIINPSYLRNHLEEEKHVKEKLMDFKALYK